MARFELSSRIETSVLDVLRRSIEPPGDDSDGAGVARQGGPQRQRWTTLAEFVGFLESVGDGSDDPLTVWRCGRNFLPMALASHFTSLHSNLSLGDALSSAVATIGRLQSGSVLRLQIDDDTALIEYRIVDPNVWPRARDAEFTLGFLDGIVRAYLGQDFRPDGLVFEHTPHDGQHFQRAVGVRCIFGEPTNLLALPRHCLAVSHGALPGLGVDDAEQVPASKLSQPSAHEEGMSTFVLRLRETILKALYDGRVDQDCVAAICGLSTRALRRKLLQHGLSFRREVQHARMCEASHLLAHTGLPIGDIAWRLGYCKQADFSRAFRDVHGVPPSALRQGIGHRGWSEC